MDATEKRIARQVVTRLLDNGYSISVWEGEDFAILKSNSIERIMKALASTDSDVLRAYDADDNPMGSVLLVWGNGEDLISDGSGVAIDLVEGIY